MAQKSEEWKCVIMTEKQYEKIGNYIIWAIIFLVFGGPLIFLIFKNID